MSNLADSEERVDIARTLKMLEAVERGGARSQRAIARDMEVALGFANAYLRRCVRKGWIKVSEAPARRYLYYVTPTGFMEKARLTAEYLSASFDMFRTARSQCDKVVEVCLERKQISVVLVGAGDLAEVAVLSALSTGLRIAAVLDAGSNREHLAGVPIVRSLVEAGPIDALIITDIRAPQETYEKVAPLMAEDRIHTPAMLRINRNRRLTLKDSGGGVR